MIIIMNIIIIIIIIIILPSLLLEWNVSNEITNWFNSMSGIILCDAIKRF